MDNGDRSGQDDEPGRDTGPAADGEDGDGPTEDEFTRDEYTQEGCTPDEYTQEGCTPDEYTRDECTPDEYTRDECTPDEYTQDASTCDGNGTETEDSESHRDRGHDSRSESEERRRVAVKDSARDDPSGSGQGNATTDNGVLYRFRNDMDGPLMWLREMLSSVAIVLLIGLLLFGVSGVWPPMVAVESGSMEPNMQVGDLVFVTEPGRLAPDAAPDEVGVVTHAVGERVDYRTFGSYGSVVIYRPPRRTASPIIHRAMFRVEAGENWYDRADDQYHSAADCGELTHCPAPHDGFITLGDNNGQYDQASGLAAPVKAEWVTGVARVRVPYLGYVRLIATGQAELRDVVATTGPIRTDRASARWVDGESGFGGSSVDHDTGPAVSGGGGAAVAAR